MSFLSFLLCFNNTKITFQTTIFWCFYLCFHCTLLFSFFVFFSFDSLKLWRTVNTHVNIPCKLLSPPILMDLTRFSLYAITKVSRKSKHTHFKSSFQNIHFLCTIFPRSNFGAVAGDGNGLISQVCWKLDSGEVNPYWLCEELKLFWKLWS